MAPLSIYYQNVRRLRTKTVDFFRSVCSGSYDVMVLTETWLDDSVYSSELFDNRYLVWRRDRDYSRTAQKRGGGVLIAVKSEITAIEKTCWRSTAEDIWVSLRLKRSRPQVTYSLHLCWLYLCSENTGNSYSIQLSNYTNNLNNLMLTHPMDKFVILGDLNFGKNVDWCHSTTNNAELVPLNSSGEHIIKFFDTVQTYGLSQYNGQRNVNDRLLDLVFSNDVVRVTENADPLDIPIDSHHKPLLILAEFVEIHKLEYNITNRYHYSIGDYSAITSELDNVNWTSLLHKDYNMSIEDAVANFYNKLYEVRDMHIPLKSTKLSTYPPWYNTTLVN